MATCSCLPSTQLWPALLAEPASGYRRVGEVFSGTGTGNPGDANAGFDNLLRSAAIFDTLRKQGISSRKVLEDERRVRHSLAGLYLGEIRQSEVEAADILRRTDANLARDPTNMDVMLVHWTTLAQGIEGAYRNSNPTLAARRAREFWRLTAAAPKDIFERVTHPEQARAGADYYGGLAMLAVEPKDKVLACAHLRLAESYAAVDPATFPDLAPALRRCPK